MKTAANPCINSMVQNYKGSGERGSHKSHPVQVRGSRETGSPGLRSHQNGLIEENN